MLFGAIFQCVGSVLTIAACLSYKSPFVSPFSKRNEADSKKKEFAICNSDHLTVLKIYRAWLEANKRSKHTGKCYADLNFLSCKTLEALVEIKQQFLDNFLQWFPFFHWYYFRVVILILNYMAVNFTVTRWLDYATGIISSSNHLIKMIISTIVYLISKE